MMLSEFEGRDVEHATMRLTGAGDGLSKALAIEPAEYHVGDTVRVIIEGTVIRVAHDPIGDTDLLKRVHTVKAGLACIIDSDSAATLLDVARRRLEEANGVVRIPFGASDDDDDE